jgi:hypothetical protein
MPVRGTTLIAGGNRNAAGLSMRCNGRTRSRLSGKKPLGGPTPRLRSAVMFGQGFQPMTLRLWQTLAAYSSCSKLLNFNRTYAVHVISRSDPHLRWGR